MDIYSAWNKDPHYGKPCLSKVNMVSHTLVFVFNIVSAYHYLLKDPVNPFYHPTLSMKLNKTMLSGYCTSFAGMATRELRLQLRLWLVSSFSLIKSWHYGEAVTNRY